MKKLKKMIASPVTTIAAFAVAAGLLLFSSIGGARAALTYFSDDYAANIQLHEIGVTLVENGAPVEGELLKGLLAEGEELKLGTAYQASTRERTVLYYNKLLASQSETPLFADKLTIDGSIADRVGETRETSGGYTTITVTYEYDGARFCIEAKVDGVQEHNAQDAIWSAWGRRVTIDNGVLSLN